MNNWFLGLDLGTSSVGWAVTDEQYNIPRIRGKRAWGVRLFNEASTAEERRGFRTGRRRLARRKQRRELLQELMHTHVEAVDRDFFARLRDSDLTPEDKQGANHKSAFSLFNDEGYTDRDYYQDFPTIWHLRKHLLNPSKDSSKRIDARHYYLAMNHILKHRGHFLHAGSFSMGDSFDSLFADLVSEARGHEILINSSAESATAFKSAIKLRGVNDTKRELTKLLLSDPNLSESENKDSLARGKVLCSLIAGGKASLNKIFGLEEEFKFSLKESFDEKQAEIVDAIGDDNFPLIELAKQLYDWAQLDDVMAGSSWLSHAVVRRYDENKRAGFGLVLRSDREKAVTAKSDGSLPDGAIDRRTIKGSFGGIVPHQLHLAELKQIVRSAQQALPNLSNEDSERICSLLTFRIPYYVGPLFDSGAASSHAWIKRIPGQERTPVRPWNFTEVVDEAASAEEFIERMLNDCTYLAGEKCLPKQSLLYEEYLVLSELNNLTIDGQKLDVEVKKKLFDDLYIRSPKKITERRLRDYLHSEGYGRELTIGGIDLPLKHAMRSFHELCAIFSERGDSAAWVNTHRASLDDAIRVITIMPAHTAKEIEILTNRLRSILDPIGVTDAEFARIARKRFTGWGAFSRELLDGIATGDSVIGYLRATNENFMQVLTNYNFVQLIDTVNSKYYAQSDGNNSWRSMLNESYASAPVKRTVTQAVRIINELIKLQGSKPKKIFIETTRENDPKKKGKRTVSRHDQLKDLYESIKKDNAEVWNELHASDMTNQRLQSKALYLYFTQEGRCLYSGERINIHDVSNRNKYDIDHIIPQSLVKDDSFTNLVLVKRELNARKTNEHTLPPDMRKTSLWRRLRDSGLMSDRKFQRLMRTTPFTEAELAGFIERQLVETSQSNKVLADVLRSLYTDDTCKVVFHKAGLTSEFRREIRHPADRKKPIDEQRILKPSYVKVRELNNLHHAKDAYLTVVCGNVYESTFSSNPRKWVKDNQHKLGQGEFHMKRFMSFPHKNIAGEVTWDIETLLPRVSATMERNDILTTVRTFDQSGGFFDQQPVVQAKAKIARKSNPKDPRSSKRYGGMSGVRGAYFALIEDCAKKKPERRLVVVPIMHQKNPDGYLEQEFPKAKVIIAHIPYKSLVERNGFRLTIDGVSTSKLIVTNCRALLLNSAETKYLKRLLKAHARMSERNSTYVIDSFSAVTKEGNLELYDSLLSKLVSAYKDRPGVSSPLAHLSSHRHEFIALNLDDQVRQLARILPLFQPNPFASSSADLTLMSGQKSMGNTAIAGRVTPTNSLVLIRQSVTGIFEQRVDLLSVDA